MSRIHTLKTWPEAFAAMLSGQKRVELRKADRPFLVGDGLLLKEYDPKTKTFSGRDLLVDVTHIQTGFGLRPDYVAMSVEVAS